MKLQLRIMPRVVIWRGQRSSSALPPSMPSPPRQKKGPSGWSSTKTGGRRNFPTNSSNSKQFAGLNSLCPRTSRFSFGSSVVAYRLTHSELLVPKAGAKSIHDLCKEALDQIVDPPAAGRHPASDLQRGIRKAFCPPASGSFEESAHGSSAKCCHHPGQASGKRSRRSC